MDMILHLFLKRGNMPNGNPSQIPENLRRKILARIYALLVRLAEEKSPHNTQDIDGEIKGPKEVIHEIQRKTNKRAILPKPSKRRR